MFQSKSLWAVVSVAWLALVAQLGCGGSNTIEVSGLVTYDGEKVESGQISFTPLDGAGPPEADVIENGQFSMQATPGMKRVQIRASRPLPPERQTSPEMGLLYEDFIPSIYNEESTLSADVNKSGGREFEFHLVSP